MSPLPIPYTREEFDHLDRLYRQREREEMARYARIHLPEPERQPMTPQPPYVHQEYPKVVGLAANGRAIIARSAEEEAALTAPAAPAGEKKEAAPKKQAGGFPKKSNDPKE